MISVCQLIVSKDNFHIKFIKQGSVKLIYYLDTLCRPLLVYIHNQTLEKNLAESKRIFQFATSTYNSSINVLLIYLYPWPGNTSFGFQILNN